MNKQSQAKVIPPRGRLIWGGAIFVFGFICPPLFVPVVVGSALPGKWKAALSGLLMLGVPELFMLIAVAILGKPGFHYFKGVIFRFSKHHLVTASVSRTRYFIGLILFVIPISLGWIAPYVSYLISELITHRLIFAVVGDLILLVSLFVLGGEFWDKLRALFIYDAKTQFPAQRG
jgi:hypothetical protein